MKSVVSKAFEGTGKKFVSVYSSSARWINRPKQSSLAYTKKDVINMTNYLIDNVTIGAPR